MPNKVKFSGISNKVINKICKYFVFTIAISWSSIFAIYFICLMFGLEYKSIFAYISEVCFMTISLSANNLRDLSESKVLKRGQKFYNLLLASNVLNMILCILFFASYNSFELTDIINSLKPELKQFWYVLGSYLVAAFMGLIVQIAGGIDQIKQAKRRGKND